MPGYSPVCDHSFECMTCRGNGWVDETRVAKGKVFTERVTVQDVPVRRRHARRRRPRPPLTVRSPCRLRLPAAGPMLGRGDGRAPAG